MVTAEEKQYRIRRDNNILEVDLSGVFSGDVAEDYQNAVHVHVEELKDNPWASLIVFQGDYILSPESEQQLTELTQYRVKNNMVAIATVFINNKHADIQQMQLTRIYQSCRVNFHMFSSIDMAKRWLNSFLDAKNKKAS